MAERIKFYTDEHVAKAVVRGLRERGENVLTVVESGLLGASDEEHRAHALAEGRVFFTQDADFLRLHAAGVRHAGLVYAPQQTSISTVFRGLMLIWQVLDAEEMLGHVEFVS